MQCHSNWRTHACLIPRGTVAHHFGAQVYVRTVATKKVNAGCSLISDQPSINSGSTQPYGSHSNMLHVCRRSTFVVPYRTVYITPLWGVYYPPLGGISHPPGVYITHPWGVQRCISHPPGVYITPPWGVYHTPLGCITPPWGVYHTPLGRFSKFDCSTTKKVPIPKDTSSESSRRDVRRRFWHRHYSNCGNIKHRTSAPGGVIV